MVLTNLMADGWINMVATDLEGNRITVYNGPNLVVDSGFSALSGMLAGDTSKRITRLRLGSGSTPPVETDTAIEGPNIIVTQPDYVDLTTVTSDVGGTIGVTDFMFTLGSTEGNGNTVREVGLYTTDDTLVARQLTGQFVKTNAYTLEITWRISIRRVA